MSRLTGEYRKFPVGTSVTIKRGMADFRYFGDGHTGKVIRNSGRYYGIIVELDEPIAYVGNAEHDLREWNFMPKHLDVAHIRRDGHICNPDGPCEERG